MCVCESVLLCHVTHFTLNLNKTFEINARVLHIYGILELGTLLLAFEMGFVSRNSTTHIVIDPPHSSYNCMTCINVYNSNSSSHCKRSHVLCCAMLCVLSVCLCVPWILYGKARWIVNRDWMCVWESECSNDNIARTPQFWLLLPSPMFEYRSIDGYVYKYINVSVSYALLNHYHY